MLLTPRSRLTVDYDRSIGEVYHHRSICRAMAIPGWVYAPAIVVVAVPIHRCLGRVAPLVVRAALCAMHAATSFVLAFVIVMVSTELVS